MKHVTGKFSVLGSPSQIWICCLAFRGVFSVNTAVSYEPTANKKRITAWEEIFIQPAPTEKKKHIFCCRRFHKLISIVDLVQEGYRSVAHLLLLLIQCNHTIISRKPCNLCTALARVGQRGPNALVCGNLCEQGLRCNITLNGRFVHSGHSKGNALANSSRLPMSVQQNSTNLLIVPHWWLGNRNQSSAKAAVTCRIWCFSIVMWASANSCAYDNRLFSACKHQVRLPGLAPIPCIPV